MNYAQCQCLEGTLVSAESLLFARSPAGALYGKETIKKFSSTNHQDENYLVSHFLGIAALSLLKVSNTIGNDNIVKVCHNS